MLKLELQNFGHLMRRTDSLEETLMLGKIEGRRRRGWQRMRWLDGITNLMDREAWLAAVHGVAKSWTWLSDWIELINVEGRICKQWYCVISWGDFQVKCWRHSLFPSNYLTVKCEKREMNLEKKKSLVKKHSLQIWKILSQSPGGTSGKAPACPCRRSKRLRVDPWVGKIPWRRAWQPTLVFLPRESHGQRSLEDCSP